MENEADDDPSSSPLHPYFHSTRPHVYVQHVAVYAGTTRTCVETHVEWTHGFFRVSHTAPRTHHTTTQDTIYHNTPQQHDNSTSRQQRQREKRREKVHFQCGGAWTFFVHGVLCLVKPVNARFLSLQNSVKYDSSLISFSAPWQVNSFIISSNELFYAVTVFLLKKLIEFRNFQNYLVMQLQFFCRN